MDAAVVAAAEAMRVGLGEDERINIILRYIQNPHFDDSDLYYNGLCDSSSFLDHKPEISYKVSVAFAVLEQIRKEKDQEEEEAEAEAEAKRRRILSFMDFPGQVPKAKRSPREKKSPNSVLDLISCTIYEDCIENNVPKKNRVTIKFRGTTVLSFERNRNQDAISIPQKRPRGDQEDLGIRAKKRMKNNYYYQEKEEENIFKENIPEKLKAHLERKSAILVIKKKLSPTDVNPNNGRLSIPQNQILDHNFLSEEEHKMLDYEIRQEVPYLDVKLIEPSGEECGIKLKKWKMENNATYNLQTPWNGVVRRNLLTEDTPIEVYSFREGGELYFAVIIV